MYDRKRLYCGDNLEILATMEKESVDLIYIDPPFFSNQPYQTILDPPPADPSIAHPSTFK